MGKDLLSVCYITKDSIQKLPESYAVMRKLDAKIMVVDTGSKDGTAEWAASRSDIDLNNFKWCDDFSKARNYAIAICNTKYILFIDDDEYIPEEYHKELVSYITKQNKKLMFFFPVVNFLQDPKWVKNPKILNGEAVRMFEIDSDIYYENKIHEKLHSTFHTAVRTQIPLYHFQYKSFEGLKDKMEKYRRLIKEDITDREVTFLDELHLANTYRETFRIYGGDMNRKNAIKHLNSAYALNKTPFILKEIKNLESYNKPKMPSNMKMQVGQTV